MQATIQRSTEALHCVWCGEDAAETAQRCGECGQDPHAPCAPCACCGEDVPASATTCPECGENPASEEGPCYPCGGEGYVELADTIQTIAGPLPSPWTSERVRCEECHGSGTVASPYSEERQEALGEAS